jgi:hypothetical protein
MIYEERIYQITYGKIPELMKLYETEGLPIQLPILGNLIGYFSTDIGLLNQVVHIWGYQSLDDRASRRARLAADAGWQVFLGKIAPFMVRQENRILIPTSFSPLR